MSTTQFLNIHGLVIYLQDHGRDSSERRPSRYMGREMPRGRGDSFRGRGRGGRGLRHEGGPHGRLEMPPRRRFSDIDSGPPHKRPR